MPPKKDKKKVLKQKQKQTQKQNVVVNITAPVAKRRRARRPKKVVEQREQLPIQRPHVFFTAQPAPAPTYNQPAPQPQPLLRQTLPLSFYDTNRPMNMGFNFVRPQPAPIATQTETDVIPTLENQLDDNLDEVNGIGEEVSTPRLIGDEEATSTSPTKIRNPVKGTLIKLGGATHKKLKKQGILDEYGELTPIFSRYLEKYGDAGRAYIEYISDRQWK